MGKRRLRDRIKNWIASQGWKMFLWGNNRTAEDYWEQIYLQEKHFKENKK